MEEKKDHVWFRVKPQQMLRLSSLLLGYEKLHSSLLQGACRSLKVRKTVFYCINMFLFPLLLSCTQTL